MNKQITAKIHNNKNYIVKIEEMIQEKNEETIEYPKNN